jgi:hypothetical protein
VPKEQLLKKYKMKASSISLKMVKMNLLIKEMMKKVTQNKEPKFKSTKILEELLLRKLSPTVLNISWESKSLKEMTMMMKELMKKK